MFVRVDSDGQAHLCDADNFRSFKVVVASGVTDSGLALAAVGRFDGDHFWVASHWIEQRGRPDDPAWHAGFQGMIGYAASAGWIDGDGAIRAHVERV